MRQLREGLTAGIVGAGGGVAQANQLRTGDKTRDKMPTAVRPPTPTAAWETQSGPGRSRTDFQGVMSDAGAAPPVRES